MNFDYKYFFMMLAWQIPHFVAVVFSAIYCFRKRTPDGILMFIGGVLSMFIGIFNMLAPMYLYHGSDGLDRYTFILNVVGIIGLVFNILYTIGFVLLMVKVSKPEVS
jgi:hypothetical protein